MAAFEFAQICVPYRQPCEDRVAVFSDADRLVVVVADGAGGTGAGTEAAATVIREIESEFTHVHSADEWSALLKQIDCRIIDGQSTAVVVDVRPYGIAGASVGDSQAWIILENEIDDLTQHQNRKPLLGSGAAEPRSFVHPPLSGPPLSGSLIVGSDGFFNYARREAIATAVARNDLAAIPRACLELVQLPSGELWDDTSVVAVRKCMQRRSRKRYEL